MSGCPKSDCFRTPYASTHRAGAFGETITSLRPSIDLLARLQEIDDDKLLDADLFRGRVPDDWRRPRSVGSLTLDRKLRFVDVDAPRTLARLRIDLAPTVRRLGLDDVDVGAIMGRSRQLTQEVARYVYERVDAAGVPPYSGIRYVSRLKLEWECWALFVDRIEGHFRPPAVETIFPEDPGLIEAAAFLGLTLDTAGSDWLDHSTR